MIHLPYLIIPPVDLDKKILNQEVKQTNINRALILALCAILINITVINFFYKDLHHGSPTEISWRKNIIALNVVMVFINCVHVLLTAYIIRYKKFDNPVYTYLPYFILVQLGAWGIAGTTFHQAVSWTIMPFVLTSSVSTIFLIRPKVLLYYSISLYLVFFFSLSINQHDANYLLLGRTLGFTALIVCYGLSLVLWNNNILRFRQDRIIESQTKDLKENYLQMLQFAKELKERNASKDKFFSILSHDLKSPVASSLVLTKLLEEEHLDEAERKEINQLFRASLDNISHLIHDVLLWANNQTGALRFEPSALSFHAIVAENIQTLHALALQKNITLVNEVPNNLSLFADKNMTETILRNLLVNAIKFTHEKGHVTVSACILPTKQVEWSVTDNGVGISPAVLENLFRIDKKVMSIGTHNETGTGLGLILCKDFIEKHGGTITVESTVGKGSRFTILLPA